MNDMFTDCEICNMYREAKDKRVQINILADLCDCDKEIIKSILVAHGLNAPEKKQKGTSNSSKRWKPEFSLLLPDLIGSGYSTYRIAKEFNVSAATVLKHMRHAGLKTAFMEKTVMCNECH